MLSETNRAVIHELVLAKKQMKGGLLPILHDIQDQLGYIPEQSVALIAQELNLSRAEVHGVITFYHHFRLQPVASNVLQVCRAEACRSMGGEKLWEHACQRLQVNADGTPKAGGVNNGANVHLEAVYCLGLCSSSPSLALNEKVHARMNAAKLDRLLDGVQVDAPVLVRKAS